VQASVLYVDRAGALWVGARDGVWRVEGRRAVPYARPLFADAVNVLCRDRAGALWVGGPTGAARIESPTGGGAPTVTRIAPPASAAPNAAAVTALYELADGRVLVGARAGLCAVAGDRLVPARAADLVDRPQGVSAFHGLLADSTQSASLAELLAPDPTTPEPTYLRGLRPCAVDGQGAVWNAVGERLLRDGRQTLAFPSEITRITVGREGLLWVATGASGFFRVARARVAAVADTVGGAHASANLYSLIETCKANGINPYHYLVGLFRALPLAKMADDFEVLLSWRLAAPTS
jgi:ligand-binding sensor domain-containing protein